MTTTQTPPSCVAAILTADGAVRITSPEGVTTDEVGDVLGARAKLMNRLFDRARQLDQPVDVRVEDPDCIAFIRVHADGQTRAITEGDWQEARSVQHGPESDGPEPDGLNRADSADDVIDLRSESMPDRPAGPGDVVQALTQLADPSPDVRELADAAVDSWGDRADLVAAADLPEDVLDGLMNHCVIPFVREGVAGNPATRAETLADLALDDDVPVRAAVASNPNLWPRTMIELAEDPEPTVRAALSTNPAAALFLGGAATPTTHRRRNRRVLIAAVAAVAIGLLGIIGVNLVTAASQPTAPATTATAWNGMTLPVSTSDGPSTFGATASGFAHTELGAALAATNLSVRIDPYAGSDSFDPTISKQTFGGDPEALLQATNKRYQDQATKAGVSDGDPIPTSTGAIVGYRIDDYSADGPTTVHLLVTAPDGQQLDFAIDVIWSDGDYRLVDPTRSTTFVRTSAEDSSSYTIW